MTHNLRSGRRHVAGLLLATTAILAACSSPSVPLPMAVRLSTSDAGRHVTVGLGGHVAIVLDSTYWTFLPVTPEGILHVDGPPQVVPRLGHCVPGQGCGTVTLDVTALAPGNASVEATRTTCGEALRCAPGQGDFRVFVVVRAPTS